MTCLRLCYYWRTSPGQKTWLYLIFRGRGLRRGFLILLSPPPSCCLPVLNQNQWQIVGKWCSSHVIVLLLLLGFHYMNHSPSGDYGNWPGSRYCYSWRAACYYTVIWFPDIGSWWGAVLIVFRSISSLVSSGNQWGLGLTWPPGRYHLMLPPPVIDNLSYP